MIKIAKLILHIDMFFPVGSGELFGGSPTLFGEEGSLSKSFLALDFKKPDLSRIFFKLNSVTLRLLGKKERFRYSVICDSEWKKLPILDESFKGASQNRLCIAGSYQLDLKIL